MSIKEKLRDGLYQTWSVIPENFRRHLRKGPIFSIFSRWMLDPENHLNLKAFDKDISLVKLDRVLKIDVVITSFKQSQFLDDSLSSVMRQNVNINKIIIINHCDDIYEKEKLRKVVSNFKDDRIHLHEISECWPGTARNFGATKCDSQYIVFLDADDWFNQPYLANALFMNILYQSSFCGADCQTFNDQGNIDKWHLLKFPKLNNLISNNAFPVGSLINLDAFKQISGWKDFDRDGERQDEAINLWRRMYFEGLTGVNLQQTLVNLRRHNSNLSTAESSKTSHLALRQSFAKLQQDYLDIDLQKQNQKSCLNLSLIDFIHKCTNFNFDQNKENILFFLADGALFGAGKVTLDLMESIDLSRYNLIVFNFDNKSNGVGLAEEFDCIWIEFGSIFPMSTWLANLYHWLQEIDPKIVFSNGHPYVDVLIREVRNLGIKSKFATTVFNVESLHWEQISKDRSIFDLVLVESELSKNALIDNGYDESKVSIIKHFAHRYSLSTPSNLRAQKKLVADIGWFHRFSPEKNPKLVLKLAKKNSTFKFLMAGQGPMLNKIISKNTYSNLVIDPRLDFNGFIDSVNTVLITSTKVEGRPLAALEALESGKLVLAFNVGSLHELRNLGYRGIYLFDNFNDMSEFIGRQLSNLIPNSSDVLKNAAYNQDVTNNYVGSKVDFLEYFAI